MLHRHLEKDLRHWMSQTPRKPLLIRGARQVGKSSLVESFADQHFEHTVVVNFELEPELAACFENLQPSAICQAISAIKKQPIIPGKTLLFLDEIQDCPNAIRALRYFKEKYNELHVIGAGSLLDLALRDAEFRMPVGRVGFLYLYPLSFKEFLHAFNPSLIDYIEKATPAQPVPEAIHTHLLKQVRLYMLLGGMPEVLASYQQNEDIQSVQAIQSSVIQTYDNDFGHYASWAAPELLRKCFRQVPLLIGSQIKYNKIDPDLRSRDLKQALVVLEDANIIQRIRATSAKGLPLDATLNEKKFKLNFIDVGLVKRCNQLDASLLLNEDIMLLNRGALAEQFVGQELLAYSASFDRGRLYFWARDDHGRAEVDYIAAMGANIIPIEVKAGAVGKLRSLKQYLLEHENKMGVRISERPLSFDQGILSVPFYMIEALPRLVEGAVTP
jgi:uncharacterized protein